MSIFKKKKSVLNSMTDNTIRIGILGAGPCGLSQLIAFEDFKLANDNSSATQSQSQFEITCYENALPVHNSMYRDLWSNRPKELLEFANYSYYEHFGKAVGSFLPRKVLYEYITGRVRKYFGFGFGADYKKLVELNTNVTQLTFDEKSKLFTIIAHNTQTDAITKQEFNYVIISTGHFSAPQMPYFKGVELFTGGVVHAHDFRNAQQFQS
jgi:trimethylamine monooxygenase